MPKCYFLNGSERFPRLINCIETSSPPSRSENGQKVKVELKILESAFCRVLSTGCSCAFHKGAEGTGKKLKLLPSVLPELSVGLSCFVMSLNQSFRHRDNVWRFLTGYDQFPVLAAEIKESPCPQAPVYCVPVGEQSMPQPKQSLPIPKSWDTRAIPPGITKYRSCTFKSHCKHTALHTTKAPVRQSNLQNHFHFSVNLLISLFSVFFFSCIKPL